MKIILEFKTKFKHDKYIQDRYSQMYQRDDSLSVSGSMVGSPIEDNTRRKRWTDLEIQFIKDNYMNKKGSWIAKQLRRKSANVYAKIAEMYRKGLPMKRPRNGEVDEQ